MQENARLFIILCAISFFMHNNALSPRFSFFGSAFRAGLGLRIGPMRKVSNYFENTRKANVIQHITNHKNKTNSPSPKRFAFFGSAFGMGLYGVANFTSIRSKLTQWWASFKQMQEKHRKDSSNGSKMWQDVAIISKVL